MKFFIFLALSLTLVACGKDVSNNGNPDVKITPNPNNDNEINDQYDGEFTADFITRSGLVNSKPIPSNVILITLPLHIQTSYELIFPKPNLDLFLNNQHHLCSYVYSTTNNKYEVDSNCTLVVQVRLGDKLTLFGTPENQTVTLKINYQNQQ